MRMYRLFGRTVRAAPADAETASHRLLVRAGMVRRLSSGLYSFLPLGLRALRRVEAIIREEMDRIGGQELLLPVLQPRELWEATGRWDAAGPTIFRLRDRSDREFCVALTHEEASASLAAGEIQSYRQLPVVVYHFQTKMRDEPRPRGGLLRVREFVMKDAYSFDADAVGMQRSYDAIFGAYARIFDRCELEAFVVRADSGIMGGKHSHEFALESDAGEDHVVLCDRCGDAANTEVARSAEPEPPFGSPDPPPVSRVSTPGATTIDQLVQLLGVAAHDLLKTVVFSADGRMVAASVPGSMEVNATKLANAIGGARELRTAGDDELAASGLVPGFLGPPFPRTVTHVVDPRVAEGRGFTAGGNEPDVHRANVVRGRDYAADVVADLEEVGAGEPCARCGAPLRVVRGIELGHLFQFGTSPYAEAFRVSYLDDRGESHLVHTGSYGIGLGRLLAAIVEAHHDARGIIWPASVAPFAVHLVALNAGRPDVAELAGEVEGALEEAGVSVLVDDRPEPAGVKFTDADLIGLPLRLTVSPRAIAQGHVEIKPRAVDETSTVARHDLVPEVRRAFRALA